MRTVFAATFLAYALLLAWGLTSAQAADLPEGQAALSRLAAPGTHAILRHAIAPGTGDPENFQLGDCRTQRNLDERGRAQARAIGAALREAGVKADQVLSSQWCRSAETARLLGLGPIVEEPALNSFFADRSTRAAQTDTTRRLLAALPRDATAILVSHQVNITALTGIYPRSGEVVVIEVNEAGDVVPAGRFLLPAPS